MKIATKGVRRFVNEVGSKGIPDQISMFRMGGVQVGKTQHGKGKYGERKLANLLRDHGYNCCKSRRYCGTNGDAGVVGLPDIHIERKRVERLNLEDVMRQTMDGMKTEKLPFNEGVHPAVFHHRSCDPYLVTIRLDDWTNLYREWDADRQLDGD